MNNASTVHPVVTEANRDGDLDTVVEQKVVLDQRKLLFIDWVGTSRSPPP